MSPGIYDNLRWVLGEEAFARLSSRLELIPNREVDYLHAFGPSGKLGYQGITGVNDEVRSGTAAWLEERPRSDI
jgi:hypothetical protein